MSARDTFATRFSLLRSVHKFTYRDLANALFLNPNTITEWAVSRRNFPNPEKLVLIADLYAVSVDWLLGRTDTLYRDDILTDIENNLIIHWIRSVCDVPDEYKDTLKRKANYSLPIRANIITLVYTSQFSATVRVLGKDCYKDDNFEAAIVSNSINIRNALADLLADQGDLVGKMLRKEIIDPPFDVSKAFQQLE